MAQAFGKYKNSEDWKPITFWGHPYHDIPAKLQELINLMSKKFINIEYKIEKENENE